MVKITEKVKDVKCGLDSTMFLTSAGTLLACGKYVLVCPSVCLSVCQHTNGYSYASLKISYCWYILIGKLRVVTSMERANNDNQRVLQSSMSQFQNLYKVALKYMHM